MLLIINKSSDGNESKGEEDHDCYNSVMCFAKAMVQDVVSYNSIVSCADWAYAAHLLDVAQVDLG